MKKFTSVAVLLIIGMLLVSCGQESDAEKSAEIEAYKAQIAGLEEKIIKLNEEIAVKDSLIEELREAERKVKDQESRKKETENYYRELEKDISFSNGYQAYTQQGPFNGNYSPDRGLDTLDKIRSALNSFSTMTSLVKDRRLLDDEEIEAIGNTDDEMQLVEFYNMPIRVKGQLLEQNYIIKALDLRRVLALYELGRANLDEVDAKLEAFRKAREQYQDFVNRTYYRDSSLYIPPMYY